MAITAAVCDSYKAELLAGIHLAADTYKIALYTSSATLNRDTTAYSATNEVGESGDYAAGGQALTGFSVTEDTNVVILDFDDPEWTGATITARGALIYNSSRSNKAVAVLDFGADVVSTAGTFHVTFPAAAAATGLIRFTV